MSHLCSSQGLCRGPHPLSPPRAGLLSEFSLHQNIPPSADAQPLMLSKVKQNKTGKKAQVRFLSSPCAGTAPPQITGTSMVLSARPPCLISSVGQIPLTSPASAAAAWLSGPHSLGPPPLSSASFDVSPQLPNLSTLLHQASAQARTARPKASHLVCWPALPLGLVVPRSASIRDQGLQLEAHPSVS